MTVHKKTDHADVVERFSITALDDAESTATKLLAAIRRATKRLVEIARVRTFKKPLASKISDENGLTRHQDGYDWGGTKYLVTTDAEGRQIVARIEWQRPTVQ